MIVRSVKKKSISVDLVFFPAYYVLGLVIVMLYQGFLAMLFTAPQYIFSDPKWAEIFIMPVILIPFIPMSMIGYEFLGDLGVGIAVILHNTLIIVPASLYLWLDLLKEQLTEERKNKIRKILLIVMLMMLLFGVHACMYGLNNFSL